MKKLLILTLLIPLLSFSQYRKMEDVAKMQGGWAIAMSYDIDDSGQVTSDTSFIIMCQNAEYQHIVDYFLLFGTKDFAELKAFINEIGNLLLTMPGGTSKEWGEYNISLYRVKLLGESVICFTLKGKKAYINKVTYNRLVKKISQLNN